jgi:apolipoprotein D and lipocalin family protein
MIILDNCWHFTALRRSRMEKVSLSGMLIMLFCACATAGPPQTPLEVVPQVDLVRYMGTWFEIASFPQRFQKGCTDSRADYQVRRDGKVEVLNSCWRDGKVDTAQGKAWVADTASNAKLKVSFLWPFRGDYWIIELGKDYEYAVVSAPSRQYLWILARQPKMEEGVYADIVGRLKERGFDLTKLVRTAHGNRTDR